MPGSRLWFGHACMVGQGVEDSLLAVWKSGMTFGNAEISASYKRKSEPGPEIF